MLKSSGFTVVDRYIPRISDIEEIYTRKERRKDDSSKREMDLSDSDLSDASCFTPNGCNDTDSAGAGVAVHNKLGGSI